MIGKHNKALICQKVCSGKFKKKSYCLPATNEQVRLDCAERQIGKQPIFKSNTLREYFRTDLCLWELPVYSPSKPKNVKKKFDFDQSSNLKGTLNQNSSYESYTTTPKSTFKGALNAIRNST